LATLVLIAVAEAPLVLLVVALTMIALLMLVQMAV